MNQEFLGYLLSKRQKVLSLIGPSGVGKSFTAEFLSKYFDYKIASQITTRDKRPDDTHYTYMSRQEFVNSLEKGEILGFFSGDRTELTGNGYGYYKECLMDELSKDRKLILFPSAYELQEESFLSDYGTTDKIGLGYLSANSLVERFQLTPEKKFSAEELASRVCVAKKLTDIMEQFKDKGLDDQFYLLYTDSYGKDLTESKKGQLLDVARIVGGEKIEYEECIDDFVK